ncbi:MAG TPA: NAD(P)/FAD-dependent oxidoreductase [Chryseosolibacter sp.]
MQVTEHFDVIVIGAGAAGLCAARELTRVKMKILLLEARHRIGGRMYTNIPHNFTVPIERGAEFIHGEASHTFQLLQEAKGEWVRIEGNTYQAHNDTIEETDFFDNDWSLILEKLETLTTDMTFADFLSEHFDGAAYETLREKITKFVEGYNAADITRVSSLALREEWSEDEDPAQYRINGGYAKLYEHLEREIAYSGGVMRLKNEVSEIVWKRGEVEVRTQVESFKAKKCLITIPVSLLSTNAIRFQPAVPHIQAAASKIGFGGVVKVTLEFKSLFWETKPSKKFKNVQFIFSDEKIPTWWSQFPNRTPLLTGWVGGPPSTKLSEDDTVVVNAAIESLANALHYPAEQIRQELKAWHVDRWTNEEFSCGAYSYAMLGTTEAINILQTPLEDTLYFAGEAIYKGPHRSTVEAALVSGHDAAKQICKKLI